MSEPDTEGQDETIDDDEFSIAELGRPTYDVVTERPAREFHAWHRPRKQFVRRSQWLATVSDLYAARDPADRLNYLGLPGSDLLDIRMLHERICLPQGRVLRFLGFDNSIQSGGTESVSLEVSLQQMKLRELVHEASKVLPDDFSRIGSGDSRAYQETVKAAPYDVVNIDLCSSFGIDPPRTLDSLYNALNKILAMQQRLQPWMLLITSMIGRDVLNESAAQILFDEYLKTLKCGDFLASCRVLFEAEDPEAMTLDSCTNKDFFLAIAIGFCNWVFRLSGKRHLSRVNLRAAFYYQVFQGTGCPDMMSMALRFTPLVAAGIDPAGLALADNVRVNECDAAVQFVRKFGRAVDVDEKLRTEPELRQTLINESAALLLEVGYDEQEYRRWVSQFSS